MTAEELIIGHYEGALTSDQQARLASMIDSSPEVRTLYEQHGNIQALMVEEAETIETSSKLDKVVVGAALGTLAEIGGQAVGFSLLGKVATVVGTLAVGGAGFLLYNGMNADDPAPKQNPPAVRTAPSTSTPSVAAPDLGTTQARTETPATIESTAVATPSVTTNTRDTRTDARADGRSQTNRDPQRTGQGGSNTSAGSSENPPLILGSGDGQTTVEHPTQTRPDGDGR